MFEAIEFDICGEWVHDSEFCRASINWTSDVVGDVDGTVVKVDE